MFVDLKKQSVLTVRMVVSGDHIDHFVVREGGKSVEADQVHQDKLQSVAVGHALTVVDKVVRSVRVS